MKEPTRRRNLSIWDSLWEWAKRQKGGASAYIRRLIEADMRQKLKKGIPPEQTTSEDYPAR